MIPPGVLWSSIPKAPRSCVRLSPARNYHRSCRLRQAKLGVLAGQAKTKAHGKSWGGSKPGRLLSVTKEQLAAIIRMHAEGVAKAKIARATGASRPTIYRVTEQRGEVKSWLSDQPSICSSAAALSSELAPSAAPASRGGERRESGVAICRRLHPAYSMSVQLSYRSIRTQKKCLGYVFEQDPMLAVVVEQQETAIVFSK